MEQATVFRLRREGELGRIAAWVGTTWFIHSPHTSLPPVCPLAGLSVPLHSSKRRKPQYDGGLVLEPKKGFYERCVNPCVGLDVCFRVQEESSGRLVRSFPLCDPRYVLVMDFQSLYPSIIREKKICFTTVDHWTPSHLKRYTGKSELAREPPVSAEGILPAVVQVLLDRRKAARTAMTNEPDVSLMILALTSPPFFLWSSLVEL